MMTKIGSLSIIIGIGLACLGLCNQTDAGLINQWKFDEANGSATAADSAGVLGLTLQGDAAFVTDVDRGQVLELDGEGDYAVNSGEPFTSDRNHTISVWLKNADVADYKQGWLSWGVDFASGRYFLGWLGNDTTKEGDIFAGIGTQSATWFNDMSQSLLGAEGTWQYWTFVRNLDENTMTLYLNGDLFEAEERVDSGLITDSGELRVGAFMLGDALSEESFHGQMDDLAIWDEALTVDEIQNAMNFGAENYQTPEPLAGDANGDGKVDGSDVTILAGNWQVGVDGTVEATWAMGDFNGDKKVDGSDVTILAGNWQAGVTAATASVPEPSMVMLLLAAIASVCFLRQR